MTATHLYFTLTAALLTAALLGFEHYFPWRKTLGRDLPRVPAYVLGVLALLIPYSALLAWWSSWPALLAVWIITLAGGATVAGLYAFDDWLKHRADNHDKTEIIEVIQDELTKERQS